MECRVAISKAEQTAILRQRYSVFVEEFHFLPIQNDHSDIESDKYDAYAHFFGVWKNNTLIASCRLIMPNPSGLPTLNTMHINPEVVIEPPFTGEISRITVSAEFRSLRMSVQIFKIMQKELFMLSEKYHLSQWIGAVEPAFLRLLQYANLPYKPIGPLQPHTGADRYPVILSVQDYLSAMEHNQ